MHPIRIDQLSEAQHAEPDRANRTAKDGPVNEHVGPPEALDQHWFSDAG